MVFVRKLQGYQDSTAPTDMAATAYDVDRPHVDPAASDEPDPLIGRRIDHFEIRAGVLRALYRPRQQLGTVMSCDNNAYRRRHGPIIAADKRR